MFIVLTHFSVKQKYRPSKVGDFYMAKQKTDQLYARRANEQTLDVLLVAFIHRSTAGTIADHIHAVKTLSTHNVWTVRRIHPLGGILPTRLDLSRFDALILHYSLYLLDDVYLSKAAKERVAAFPGVKVLFVQDEYRQVNAMKDIIRKLGIDLLFTCVPEPEIEKVYPAKELPGLTKINTLTGYVPESLLARATRPLRERPIDVGYRARKLPYWLGRLGVEKWRLASEFLQAVKGRELVCDISAEERDRVYGDAWIEFLSSCKAVLGTESGASVFDFSGDIQRTVDAFVATHPNAPFEEVQERFFTHKEGNIRHNQISPRCFEAAALRTAMILLEGEYSGILQPWRHYVPLKKDYSNLDEVVAVVRDPGRLQSIADTAYREVALNERYSYRAFVSQLDAAIQRVHESMCAKKQSVYHSAHKPVAAAQRARYTPWTFRIAARPTAVQVIFGVLSTLWGILPPRAQNRLRAIAKPIRSALERLA
ncbi:MAG: glycosyltransferase [Burkholderiales bacterium]|nr:glycosyltransferase [Burkholderiales bacterium]